MQSKIILIGRKMYFLYGKINYEQTPISCEFNSSDGNNYKIKDII